MKIQSLPEGFTELYVIFPEQSGSQAPHCASAGRRIPRIRENLPVFQNLLPLVLLLLLIVSCAAEKKDLSFAEKIEKAHNKKLFVSKKAIQYDFLLYLEGKKHLDATVTALPDLGKIRMDLDSLSLIYDGNQLYQTPSDITLRGARFHLFTWPYFMAMPFKLTDPGTNWHPSDVDSLNGKQYLTRKLTFDPGTGDTPDDWYIVFADPETYRLEAAAYIVTFFGSKEEAEKDPHAIVYSDYQTIDGIPISTKWSIKIWRKRTGLGRQIEHAELSNIRFVDPPADAFTKPENAKIITYKN